ncbi:MAG: aminotransferase class I/II-fold pyridoxal phosphate-dependent enzyme [Candidatus Binatia bacterium]
MLNGQTARKVLRMLRRRLRWLVRPPRVSSAVPPMFPGALRMDEQEETAVVEAVRAVIRSKKLFRFYGISPLQPSKVREFERAFADRVGTGHALAVNSGTSALVCALVGLGIGPGDEVIVPAYTWFSTASAVVAVGAVPIVAEVDDSLTLDASDIERKISRYTKAIVAVHMRGAPAHMERLTALARDRNLRVIEDAAQAVGGSFRGRALGSLGDAGAHSFQMSKIMTAGEGGMLTTPDGTIYRRAAMYHDTAVCPHLGIALDDWLPGVNLRMSELHAAVLLAQLARLERTLAAMRTRKARLKELIGDRLRAHGVRFRTIHDHEGDTAIALVFFLPDPQRARRVITALTGENAPASPLYQDLAYLPHDHIDLHVYSAWTPILRQRTWAAEGGPWQRHPREIAYSADMCPVTLDLLRRAVHIDISPELSAPQVEQSAAAIIAVVEAQR